MRKLIGYIRVSTDEQEVAGNGLDAQRAAIIRFAADNNCEIVEIVEEALSAKLGIEDRPVLKAALIKAVKIKAFLVVSKLDRLSRRASFILNMMDRKANFVVTQFGFDADEFMLHMYAVLGEKERVMIGQRTRDALAQLKAKGVKLGNPSVENYVGEDGNKRMGLNAARELGAAVIGQKADMFATKMEAPIRRMVACGMSMRAIAAEFNENGTKTARGGLWSASTVSNIMARWA